VRRTLLHTDQFEGLQRYAAATNAKTPVDADVWSKFSRPYDESMKADYGGKFQAQEAKIQNAE
jgi:hypothetical protein